MKKRYDIVEFLYTNRLGRLLMWLIIKGGLPSLAEHILSMKLSKPLIKVYINKHQIDMKDFQGQTYSTFKDFFERKRRIDSIDITANHLISPCDGLLSAYPIREDSIFPVKGFSYRIQDLVDESTLARIFQGGMCVIIRLRPTDYHHYCYIDDGFQYTNHFIQGTLHSVQPVACENIPVYRLNRRVWTLMDTSNFGKVIQIGVGAMLVGGIINENSCIDFKKGEEMGHFELAGSTIVLLFEKGRVRLCQEMMERVERGEEIPVRMGDVIGTGEV